MAKKVMKNINERLERTTVHQDRSNAANGMIISFRGPDEIEERFPGSLASQWIPPDRSLWKMENYLDFLAARRELLTAAASDLLSELLHGFEVEEPVEAAEAPPAVTAEVRTTETAGPVLPGGVESEEEEELIVSFNEWVMNQGLPEGELFYEAVHPETGEPLAILDLAWPRGLQEGLSEPVALLVDEGPTTLTAASAAGFKFFTRIEAFLHYVEHEVLALDAD